MKRVKPILILSLVGFWLCARAHAMTIIPTFDTSVTSLADAAQVESAVDYVCQQYGALFSNPISIHFEVSSFPGTSVLGQSNTVLDGGYSYNTVYTSLLADKSSANQQSVIASLNGTNPASIDNYSLPVAEALALGLDPKGPTDTNLVGSFTFGAGNSYTFDPSDRAVPGEYDFIGIAEHEISEIMGRTTGLGALYRGSPAYMVDDLFRYTGPGVRSLSQTESGAYFSIDSGATDLMNYNPSGNGGDLGDWAIGQGYDSYQAFGSLGVELPVSPVDITQMSVLGYNPVSSSLPVPEPPSIAMITVGGLGLLLVGRSRRTSRTINPMPVFGGFYAPHLPAATVERSATHAIYADAAYEALAARPGK